MMPKLQPGSFSRFAVVRFLYSGIALATIIGMLPLFAADSPPPTGEPSGSAGAAAPAAAPDPAAAETARPTVGETGEPAAEVLTGETVGGDGEESRLFFETLDVTVVNLDVYVTDKAGNPVKGLTKDDFEVFENKKPVTVTNFYAVEDGLARNEKGEVETVPSKVPGMPPVPVVPEDQRLRLVLYVDNFNIRPFNRNRVFRQLREFLRKYVGPDDRVMLVTYDRELHVRHGFTSDSTLISSALFDLEKLTGFGVQADSERRDILRAIEDAEDAYQVEGRVRQYAQSLENDLQFSIGAIKELVGSLAGLPGRKALLYVSDGLPMRPAEDMFQRVQEKFQTSRMSLEAFSFDASRRFSELAASANANRVSFYTLEAAGLRVSTTLSAENAGFSSSALADSTYFYNLQTPLRYLAEATGGQAIVNTNDPTKGLQKVAQDFDNYYSLGYSPAHSGDGRYYKVDVKIKGRKDLEARTREGYRDKSADARMGDGTLATLYFGFEDNTLGVSTEVVRQEKRSDGHYQVTIAVRLPIGKLQLLPQADVHEARARLFVSAMDSEGRKSEVQQVPLSIRIPTAEVETARSKDYLYEITLVMREGPQKLAIGVRDEVATTAAFVSRHLLVGRG